MNTQLAFHEHHFNVIERSSQIWLTSSDLAAALQYKNEKSITNLFNKNFDEFTPGMSEVIESVTSKNAEPLNLSASGNLKVRQRIFSLRGAHLIAMFARTPVAKEFRRWVLDILDQEVKKQSSVRQMSPAIDMLNIDLLIQIRDGNVKDIRQIGPDMFIGKVDQILNGLRESGWIVIKRELLAEKLATW
ncbi:hypothetical protein DU191_25510 [Salmonella enterica subsp. enterica serovar Sandiego]|nr:hypothetical protein [Salmonella enterica subsp. enterica serovar Sandiego]